MATTATPSGACVARTIVDCPRKLPISTISPSGGHAAAAAASTGGLVRGQPALDAAPEAGRRVVRASRHPRYTPRPNTTTHATPEQLQHPVAGEDLLRCPTVAVLEHEQQ